MQIDLENYHDKVKSAKSQYTLHNRIMQGPQAVNNPIKTRQHKSKKQDFDEVKRVGEILKQQSDGPTLSFFLNQSLQCLEVGTTLATTLRSSYFVEVQIETSGIFNNKVDTVRFPVKLARAELHPTKYVIKEVYPQRDDFPKVFDPFPMPGSHFMSAYNQMQIMNLNHL